jgi:site-specific DNA recombinase
MEKESIESKTGVIYARVSSWEQVSNTSLDRQIRECREYAKRFNIEIIADPFVEEGQSAKSAERDEFQKAIKFCATTKKPKVDFFIVHKIDRFARNQADHVATQVVLRKVGTTLVSATEPIDQTVMGRAMEGMLSVWAELDNNIRAERSKSGMVEKSKRGIWVWQAPLGYKRLVKGGNLVIDEEKAHFIQLLFEEYAKGIYSYQSLATHLSGLGFKTRTGKKPCHQLMEKIIRNPVYCGIIRAWGHESKGVFVPIISEELFWKCQTRTRGKFGSGKRYNENPLFPLRKFTICPHCDNSFTGSASTGRGGIKYPYYHHQKQDCPFAGFIPKETLEQNFIEFLKEVSPRTKNEKLFKAVVMDIWQNNYKRLDADNNKIRREIENLEGERQRIFDMHRSGKYTDEEFLEQKNLVNVRIQESKNLLDEKRIEEFNMDEALEYCFNFIRASGKTWERLADAPALRLRFQKAAFPEKVTFDGEKFGTKKMSLVYELNQDPHIEKSHLVTILWPMREPFSSRVATNSHARSVW